MNLAPQKVDELSARLPELEDAMNYRLSDAIREGALVTGQAVGHWQTTGGDLCALSSAYLALKARHMV
jgi:hypothetical protein